MEPRGGARKPGLTEVGDHGVSVFFLLVRFLSLAYVRMNTTRTVTLPYFDCKSFLYLDFSQLRGSHLSF